MRWKEIVICDIIFSNVGMYGEQEGDGKSFISNEDQIMFTAEQIFDFVAVK